MAAQTSLPSARFRNSSQHNLLAFRIAFSWILFAILNSPWLLAPVLFLLTALLRLLLSTPISSFHHLFDIAQIVMTRVCSFGAPVKVVWIYSISSSSSAIELSTLIIGLGGVFSCSVQAPPNLLSTSSGLAANTSVRVEPVLVPKHSSSLSLSSYFFRAQPRIFHLGSTFRLSFVPPHFHSIITWSDGTPV